MRSLVQLWIMICMGVYFDCLFIGFLCLGHPLLSFVVLFVCLLSSFFFGCSTLRLILFFFFSFFFNFQYLNADQCRFLGCFF